MRVELEGHRSDRHIAWSRLADTDLLNRIAGNGAVRMRLEPREDGAPPTVVGEMDGMFGAMPFTESTVGWVHERWFVQDRVFHGAPIATSCFRLELRKEGDGVVPRVVLDVEPAHRWMAPAINARIGGVGRRWQKLLDELPAPGQPDRTVVRPLSAEARAALERWRPQCEPRVVQALEHLLQSSSETELRKLRPFGVADRYRLDRQETLVGMLRAVSAGLLELVWTVRCERCSASVSSATSLSDIADHAGCPSCGVSFATDLAETVEVVFAPHPSILARVEERFCTVFPAGAPEVRCALGVAAGRQAREIVEMVPGTWLLGSGQGEPDLQVEVASGGAEQLHWRPGASGSQRVRPGPVELRVDNDAPTERRVTLLHQGPLAPPVHAIEVAMLAEFRRQFGPAALSAGARISARSVALLFTDLSGSTALYEAVGDARAYGLVRDHFEILRRVIDAHRGMVVKTIGDAVMASFTTSLAALEAAFAMREAFSAWIATQGLDPAPRLNVGLHVGPALAVHSDTSGLDWFGRTVNLAARAQSAAKDGAIVLTAEAAQDVAVRAQLQGRGAQLEPFEAELKGLGKVSLVRC
jgi:adenylate cyclase